MHYIAYTSISSSKSINEIEENLENSMSFKKIQQSFLENFEEKFLYVKLEKDCSRDSFNLDLNNPDGTLFIDILYNHDKKHRKLDKIIEWAPKNLVIVVHNINVFGTIEQIKNYYRIFRDKQIYVLCFDNMRLSGLSEYSTSDFGFRRRYFSEYCRAYDLIERISSKNKLLDNRGAIAQFSSAFKESYWLYEAYQIPEHIAIAASGIARSPFHRKCALYEYSNDYRARIDAKNNEFTLTQLPKRFLMNPKLFQKLEQVISPTDNEMISNYPEHSNDIERIIDDACIELNIPSIHPVNYLRCILRQETGRKGISAFRNYDKNIIDAFNKFSSNPQNKLDEFWIHYKNNTL